MEKEHFEFFRKKRFFPIGNDINNRMAEQLQETVFLMLNENASLPIHMFFNSGGGEVRAALTMYDFLISLNCSIMGYVNGKCHSAALVILAGCKTKRTCTTHSRFLHHAITTSIEVRNVLQEKNDIELLLTENKKIVDAVATIHKNSFGIQNEEFLRLSEIGQRTRIPLFADEAKKYGMIHEIVDTLPINFSI